tara:strand:- start:1196 stop:1564 length:369 start_codon:yes stop_codon:yes gene_type:complete
MTRREFQVSTGSNWPKQQAFRNFTWSVKAIKDWEWAWGALWRIGIKWEWQNSDRYARRYGDTYNLFAVHNDAERLDMAIPLPSPEIILQMHEYLLDLPTDDHMVDEATNLIRKWIRTYAPQD